MSEPAATVAPNGDLKPVSNVFLAARIEVCLERLEEIKTELNIVRVDTGVIRVWVDRLRLNAKDTGGLLKRVANDQLEIRTGIPARWPQRFALVIAGGVLGTILGSLLVIFVAAAIKHWL